MEGGLKIPDQSADCYSIYTDFRLEMTRPMLDTPLLSLMSRALDYASTRQEVLSNNIANVNTPGYKRHDASFDEVMAMAQGGAYARISDIKTQTRHMFTAGKQGSSSVEITTPAGGSMRVDGNNVDMDSEMSTLASNQIYYQTISQLTSGTFADLKAVIKGQ